MSGNNPHYNLTDQKISFTFQNILQTDGFGNFYNGLGDEIYISGGTGSGASGISGLSGIQGIDGVSGLSGISGSAGISGLSGIQGIDGVSGLSGISGVSGVAGPTGPYAEFYFQSTRPSPDPQNLGARWIDNDNGIEYVWVYDGVSYLWMQPTQLGSVQYNTLYITAPTYSPTFSYEYYGVTYTGGVCTITLPAGNVPSDDGRMITIADEVGGINTYGRGIIVQGSGGQLINGNSSISMKLNWMSLTFLFRNNSWKTI